MKMKLGMIIVFNYFEKANLIDFFIKKLKRVKHVQFCLVNNNNDEETLEILSEIAEQCKNTSVINISKSKSNTSAVRAGARYMSRHFNLKHIGFITDLHDQEILNIIEELTKNQNEVLIQINKDQNSKTVRQTFFQRLFSITDCLNNLRLSQENAQQTIN
ncbi:family 2 glycosyl transferase [Flavobacteriaceae bacterium R38]|nr:family 2 glycosyl transferase [Flavobacteriaceae bacterium R38]